MTRRDAILLFGRLCAHFPSLGGEDDTARVRAKDWCAVIERSDATVGADACQQLVEHQSMPPRIADWQETVRVVAARRQLERPAIEGPPEKEADPEKVHALVGALHSKLRAKAPR